MKQVQIKNRWTGAVLFTADIPDDTPSGMEMRAALEKATQERAYLAGADLARANLAHADLTGANLAGAYLAHAYRYSTDAPIPGWTRGYDGRLVRAGGAA